MTEMREKFAATLNRVAERLRETCLPDELAAGMEWLALLGGDLAKVGTIETTATINFFSHGKPPDPDRSFR
jgi:hypothetical protein